MIQGRFHITEYSDLKSNIQVQHLHINARLQHYLATAPTPARTFPISSLIHAPALSAIGVGCGGSWLTTTWATPPPSAKTFFFESYASKASSVVAIPSYVGPGPTFQTLIRMVSVAKATRFSLPLWKDATKPDQDLRSDQLTTRNDGARKVCEDSLESFGVAFREVGEDRTRSDGVDEQAVKD